MKSINQIFKNNKHLLEYDEIQELIDYCQSLEDEIIDIKQKEKFSFETKLTLLVNELNRDIDDIITDDENVNKFPFRGYTPPNFKDAFYNLKKHFKQFSIDNNYDFDKN